MKNLFFSLVMLMSMTTTSQSQVNCLNPDYNALVALYNSMDGTNWLNTWDTNDCDICNWYGVTCDANDRVVGLDLKNNDLTGILPPEIEELDMLSSLDVANNNLMSPLPDELWTLMALKFISLRSNNFTDAFPAQIVNLVNLETLSLGDNNFTGSISIDIGNLSKLSFLALFSNDLSGPIPDEIWTLTNLYWLNLNNNNFSGPLSSGIGGLVNLQNLGLASNQLSGVPPSELGLLSNLYYAQLQNNQFTGKIPAELSNLGNITAGFFLWNNPLDYCIPDEMVTVCGLNFDLLESDGSAFIEFCTNGLGSCCLDEDEDGICVEDDNCLEANPDQADADCDGVGDICDICPGGDDSIDQNEDGLADCAYFPGMDYILEDWKCGNNKVLICHNGNTICVSPNALDDHLGHGDYLGPCNYASCENEDGLDPRSIYKYLDSKSTSLSPNPAFNMTSLNLSTGSDGVVKIQIVDSRGKLCVYLETSAIVGNNRIDIDLTELNNGIYFLQLIHEDKVQVIQFTKVDSK